MSEPCINADRITRHGMEIEHTRKHLDDHIASGKGWRVAVAGIVVTLIIQVTSFVYFYGRLNEQVEHHDKLLSRVESKVFP